MFKTYDDGDGVHVDLGNASDGPLALSQRAAEAVLGVMLSDPATLVSDVIVHRHRHGPSKVRDATSLAGINRRNSRFWAGDNEPEPQLRKEQEAALAGNRAGGSEIWDATGEEFEGEAASDAFDPAEFGVERMADGRFQVRRRRRDRRAADAGTVLDWGSSTQDQIGGLRQLNAFYRRHWETKR